MSKHRDSPRDRRRERSREVREKIANRRLQRAAQELYPDRYVGPETAMGLSPGPCIVERKWAGRGVIIRTVDGRCWTVARSQVIRG